jgi:hypothetical protein
MEVMIDNTIEQHSIQYSCTCAKENAATMVDGW